MTDQTSGPSETEMDALWEIADRLQVLANTQKNLLELNGIALEKMTQGGVDVVSIEVFWALQSLMAEQEKKLRNVIECELLECVKA
ncbi:hypothetical protein FDK21_19275 [Cohaesibacter sp. CAU 1516]|uniref:hypothetical protein n=1 Tax=Cohaesibacter sp. CAU 1516 TaxID=2576038 RepID=UPI0010FEEBD8|nr:hypothetical protein [Cohaesibacter sp. CAU 1516]TLP42656.1 hypothetical protein FDK21_19275 [Cohaesibacter sp. CAU 1516]